MESGIPTVALVVYTNAGKTSLLNALAGSDAYADDRYFATLDPLTRKVYSPLLGCEILITDTVGFIDRLPLELIAAFKATLEEAIFADVLALVVDGADPEWQRKLEVVEQTLTDIGAAEIPRILIFTKADLFKSRPHPPNPFSLEDFPPLGGVSLSAVTGEGLDDFWRELGDKLRIPSNG